MDSCGMEAVGIEFCARELPPQPHLCALWEDEVVEEAIAASRVVECELLQCGKSDPSPGGCVGR